MYCPNCGKELPEDAPFCIFCSSPISSTMDEETAKTENIDVISQTKERTANSFRPHLTKTSLLISGVIIVLGIISLICIWPRPFNPQKVSESGIYELHQGESVYLDSIASTLMFSEAQIDNIDYDTLSLNLVWKLQLKPEKKLNSNNKDELDYCAQWIPSAHLNDTGPMMDVSAHTDYSKNCVYFAVRGTVSCREDPSSLRCIVNNNLDFVLLYDFPFSFEDIAMEKVKMDIDKKHYAEASSILQEINTPEAQTMLEGIKCIDYAEGLIDKLTFEYSMLFLTGIEFSFEYDPVSYTFYEFMTMSDLYDALYSIALYENPDPKAANEEALLSNAKDLYTDYFYPEGYTSITCTVIERNRSGDIWGQASYRNDNSLAPSPTPSTQSGNKPSNSSTNDYPPTLPPVDPNDPNAGLYSRYFGLYVNKEGYALEVGMGSDMYSSYYARIYQNLSDARNYAEPLLEVSEGEAEYGTQGMGIAFRDVQGEIYLFREDDLDENNLTFDLSLSDSYYGGINVSGYSQSTYYMIERGIDISG